MKKETTRWLLIFMSLAVYLPASAITNANTYEAAEQLYQQGKFQQSAVMARKLRTADAYSLAAKSTMVEAVYLANKRDKISLFEQVILDSKQALVLEPTHLLSHLNMAMALGFIADHKNFISAYFNGYAEKGKYHLDQALSTAPEDPWVNGLYGMWHLQVVARAKTIMAKKLYGASTEMGLKYCNKARNLASNNLQILYGCAVSLFELNKELYKNQSREMLKSIVSMEPRDVADSYIIRQAKLFTKR